MQKGTRGTRAPAGGDFHNFNGTFVGSNGSVFDQSGNDIGGYDIYIDSDGKVNHISANTSGVNKYYGWSPGTDANGKYATVTGELSAEEVRMRLDVQAGIQSRYIEARKQITTRTDPGVALYAFPVVVGAGYFGVLAIEAGVNWIWAGPVAVKAEEETVSYYRGGDSFEMSKADIRSSVDKTTGLMNTRGVSINTNKFDSFVQKYGGAWKIDVNSIPEELEINFTSGTHYEIVAKETGVMTMEAYQAFLQQIRLMPYNVYP